MTVETETIKVTANGNDAATVFSFSPIVITEADDLVVVHVDADGVETTLSEGTGASAYAVTVSEYPGTGSITYPEDEVTPLPTGERLVITRVLALLQPVDLENQGGYFADVQEQVFDRGIMITQQLNERLDRTVVLPISVTGVDAELPIPEGDKVLGWNTDADALENKTPNTSAYITLPVSATDNGVVRFDGTSGAAIQDSGVTIDDSDNMNVPGTISENGTEVVKETRDISAGAGLTGGGDLSANRTFAVGAGTGIVANADDVALDIASQAEAEAGTDNTKAMTPLRTAEAIAALGGKLLQRAAATLATYTTVTAQIPYDDTIPQSGEGTEILTQAITPTDANSILRVTAIIPLAGAATATHFIMALFRDSGADAVQVTDQTLGAAGVTASAVKLIYEVVAGSTSSTTFKLRVGTQAATTLYVNGADASRRFGGASHTILIVEEIAA